MKLLAFVPMLAYGQYDMDSMGPMIQQMMPMFKSFYNNMDHEQSMADFKKDDNGLFKEYFSYCDVDGNGVLSPSDDQACSAKMQSAIGARMSKFGITLGDAETSQAMAGLAMFDQMGKELFDEIIDANGDGVATLEEIEMGGYCLMRASSDMMIQMMDRNRNGKLDKSETGGIDIGTALTPDMIATAKQYVPDIERVIKKAKRIIRKSDMDHDKAYDSRELTKIMLDMSALIVNRVFN